MSLENTIREGSKILRDHNIRSHTLDAEVILSNIMGVTREFLLVNNNLNLSNEIKFKYKNAILRRVKNEPVAYIIEAKEFWSKNFNVNRSTLVPRPETELMLYEIIALFKSKSINILDIGTGSGCILISILKELKKSRGIGIDISAEAIKVAKLNSKKHNLHNRIKFKCFDLNSFFIGKYDLIVSNPPYILTRDLKNLGQEIKNYEPLIALDGGIDGLDVIKKIIYKSKSLLKENGILAIEIGYGQYPNVSCILENQGLRIINKVCDNNKNVRCIISTKR